MVGMNLASKEALEIRGTLVPDSVAHGRKLGDGVRQSCLADKKRVGRSIKPRCPLVKSAQGQTDLAQCLVS
jgi:predicted GNAT family acetyltransferase